MVKPVDPSNPTSGDGNEKYNPNPKHGPGKFDETLEKSKAERLKDMADKVKIAPLPEGTPNIDKAISKMDELRAQMEARKAARAAAKDSGSSGNMGISKLSSRDITKNNKAGGVIKSSASKRADGCAIRGKTRA
jgi:hypothetical protein